MHRMIAPILATLAAAAVPAAFAEDAAATLREHLRERGARIGRAARVEPAATAGARRLGAGTHELHLDHDGLRRSYLVHVPPRRDADTPAAVVLAFHGGGGHAAFMADDARYGLVGKADREGFVVVFPNGYSRRRGGRLATWNAGGCCGEARDRGIDDVGFVRALVERLKTQVAVDPARIFATGMSNGGMMSYRLACEAADVFAAVASVAGTEAVSDCRPARPIPVLHIHAKNDTHVLFDGGAGPEAFRDPGQVMQFTSVPDTVARWVARNRCDPAPTRTLERPGATCETYRGCAGDATVELCVTESGGHSWPGADSVRRGKEPASQALSANDVIWAFFATSRTR